MNRREFCRCASSGLTMAGLGLYPKLSLAAALQDGHALAPKPTHFPPKAKQLIFIFLTGGMSHLDTFDPKPRLRAENGKPIPAFGLRPDEAKPLPILGSPFAFEASG